MFVGKHASSSPLAFDESNTDNFYIHTSVTAYLNKYYFIITTSLSFSSESDVDLVSMVMGKSTSSITADSAFGTLTAGAATRSQVTMGATSQFSEVSKNTNVKWPLNGYPTLGVLNSGIGI